MSTDLADCDREKQPSAWCLGMHRASEHCTARADHLLAMWPVSPPIASSLPHSASGDSSDGRVEVALSPGRALQPVLLP